ncbi:MAG: hypothetical protein ACOY0T_41035 [Myxococcota bacterium]
MEFGRRWTIQTSFGRVKLRVLAPSDAEVKLDEAARARALEARFHLLYELREHFHDAPSGLRDVWRFFRGEEHGFGPRDRAPTELELMAFEQMLDREIATRRVELDLEPFWTDSLTEHERTTPIPPLRALPEPPPETSFIAVNLLDQDGNPVIGRRWIIELPDGSKHEGRTDAEGWARVRGFTQDGAAKVMFPEFDELDHETRVSAEQVIEPVQGEPAEEEEAPAEEPAPADQPAAEKPAAKEPSKLPDLPSIPPLPPLDILEDKHFLEFKFVDPQGKPLANQRFSLTLEDGKVVEGASDASGVARIEDLSGKTAQLDLIPEAPAA